MRGISLEKYAIITIYICYYPISFDLVPTPTAAAPKWANECSCDNGRLQISTRSKSL